MSAHRHAMVVHAYYPLGETRVQREAAVLVGEGIDVDVVALRGAGERRTESVDGVTVYRIPIGRNRALGMAFQLLEYLAFMVAAGTFLTFLHLRHRYRSVQVHNLPDFLVFCAIVPKITGARIVLDLHDLMPEFLAARLDLGTRHPLVRLVALQERLACRFADVVVTVTDGWRERLIGRGVPAERVAVVMNVADPDLFRRRPEPAEGGPFTVVYHGTFTHRYGVDVLVEAVERLREQVPKVRLCLLGDGDARPEVEAAVEERGLDDVVELSEGMVDVSALQPYLRDADVGVVPNRSSVFTDDLLPTKLLEYVAVGIPVAAARTPMIERHFDEDMVAYFTPGDAGALAECLAELAASPDRRRRMAAAADRFGDSHGWDRMAAEYLAAVRGGS